MEVEWFNLIGWHSIGSIDKNRQLFKALENSSKTKIPLGTQLSPAELPYCISTKLGQMIFEEYQRVSEIYSARFENQQCMELKDFARPLIFQLLHQV